MNPFTKRLTNRSRRGGRFDTMVRPSAVITPTSAPPEPTARPGVGRISGHHGELLQGCFGTEDGQLIRALVTLPCPVVETRADFEIRDCGPLWSEANGPARKAIEAAHLTARLLGQPDADIAVGDRASAVGMRGLDVFRTDQALTGAAGPPYYGFPDITYRPIESLV